MPKARASTQSDQLINSTKILGTVRQIISSTKVATLVLFTKFFDKRNIQNTEGFPCEIFFFCQGRKLLEKKRDTSVLHSFLVPKIFRQTLKWPPHVFLLADKKLSSLFVNFFSMIHHTFRTGQKSNSRSF